MFCLLANLQILTDLICEVFDEVISGTCIETLYNVSHNTCKKRRTRGGWEKCSLFIYHKGTTRAF
ncbi:RtcB family protein [Candidatus Coxiella mudrowiae]|uniref:RtcB family protein n=1 Tax=Candidatus Coxiella mudrowiae TaxID=2054173 RepID=UPI002468146C|nr:RtcB family protein [Candidatus Coxiella mudrowiae]